MSARMNIRRAASTSASSLVISAVNRTTCLMPLSRGSPVEVNVFSGRPPSKRSCELWEIAERVRTRAAARSRRRHTHRVSKRSQVVFIGGRSGAGKTAVAAEMFTQLARANVMHCLIEGDNLDMAHPTPWEQGQPLAELNLAAMWRNYKSYGHHRLIYTNTAAVLEPVVTALAASMGDDPEKSAILLTATDETTLERLERREVGTGLVEHVERSSGTARHLDDAAPSWVRRICTDNRAVADIAAEIIGFSGWRPRATRE
jgi:cytidylate kinase